jgi:branched-chain amino acid transport system permease protein
MSAEQFALQPDILGKKYAVTGRGVLAVAAVFLALFGLPPIGSDYLFNAILIPVLVLSLAGLGLNLLVGYTGQLSVGSAAFMAVGAFSTYNVLLRSPWLPFPVGFAFGGVVASLVGSLFGLPSLRIRGFYLIVSTLAAQFFVEWVLTRFSWFSNGHASGVISAPPLSLFGYDFGSPGGRFQVVLATVVVLWFVARNLTASAVGRNWMAVRDMDTAAAVIGIGIVRTKMQAFAVSSFYLGVAGALWAFAYVGTVEPHGFDINRSFQILFIVIIGGLGSLEGGFLGAVFITLLPILLSHIASRYFAGWLEPGHLENVQKILFGSLIILFLVKEPEGLARLVSRLRRRVADLRSRREPVRQ